MNAPLDAGIRARALDASRSFIVQAPAGSGKTELLTRRVLTLLATVDEPEQILAITFTRKAASEMRQRVVEALERAATGRAASSPYEAESIVLARAALARDSRLGWQLVRNPQRINLRTIDALATQLAHRLPVTSQLGAGAGIVEEAGTVYREVASRFIDEHIEALDLVMLQLGNRLEQAQNLLANLLANRDQWKRHVYAAGDDHDALRALLEGMLGELIESRLENLCVHVPAILHEELPLRLRIAAGYLLEDCGGDMHALSVEKQAWIDMQSLPDASIDELEAWRSIGEALLTKSDDVRKTITKAIGFPAKSDAKKRGVATAELESHKQAMLGLLEQVRETPEFVAALIEVCGLPTPRYSDDQWNLLSQLLGVLPDLLVELQMVFAERSVVDFVELAERAQRALGTEDAPTDLALAMDLSLKHILVDEFQDTSQTQFRLFRQLVNGWMPGDGRTFFAVGDPMQSIYRFRDADVALFGKTQAHGIGSVILEPLILSVNFRAAPVIIDWVNNTFSRIFPALPDTDSGAVPYSVSTAHLSTDGEVAVHALVDTERLEEATLVADLSAAAIATDRSHQVVILVRTRGQAADIFAALRARGLSYQAIDMDLVGERSVVRDLMSLCLALRYPHDRLHWLSLLRAPFVGLTLHDLSALMTESGSEAAVIDLLQDPGRLACLSDDGKCRLQRFISVIEPALKHASRASLMPWVESVWLQLGGPAVCRNELDANAAEYALIRLRALESEGRLWQKSVLGEAMQNLYATGVDDPACQIQVMTLHKAKGLEFDTVILPALDRQPRTDGVQLLNWFEGTLDGQPQLLLAPFEQSGLGFNQRERINRLVRKARERCDDQEKLRLLYVACTRAKRNLHLIARASANSQGEFRPPIKASLLNPLWPVVEPDFQQVLDTQELPVGKADIPDTHKQVVLDSGECPTTGPYLERLPIDWQLPPFSRFMWERNTRVESSDPQQLDFLWAGREARDIGTVVHRQLQYLSDNAELLKSVDVPSLKTVVLRQLQNLGIRKSRLNDACKQVLKAVENTLSDERGRWILDIHEHGRTEWALSVPTIVGGQELVQKVVIDRTFVDKAGTRWIVDFKTGEHSGGQVDVFLDSEKVRYADQLNRYTDIIRRIDDRPIKVGLYFPMLKGWREWVPPDELVPDSEQV